MRPNLILSIAEPPVMRMEELTFFHPTRASLMKPKAIIRRNKRALLSNKSILHLLALRIVEFLGLLFFFLVDRIHSLRRSSVAINVLGQHDFTAALGFPILVDTEVAFVSISRSILLATRLVPPTAT